MSLKFKTCRPVLFTGLLGTLLWFGSPPPVSAQALQTADPTVPRPNTQPCVVELFNANYFSGSGGVKQPFAYAPPVGCPAPWAKVVLETSFTVDYAGESAPFGVWLGGVNLYYGHTLAIYNGLNGGPATWTAERDLTDYAPLFTSAGTGQSQYYDLSSDSLSTVAATARLLFYPPSTTTPAPKTADRVLALGADPQAGLAVLKTSTDTLSAKLNLPRNIERAYLDIFAQGYQNDTGWWHCIPDKDLTFAFGCGGGDFREVEVSIDGQPAGVAPILPVALPNDVTRPLTLPLPGARVENLMPYRVDISPFAGPLSDGQPHQVSLNVAGAHNLFVATANLMLYQDTQVQQVTGKITRNTLIGQAPNPTVNDTLQGVHANFSGDVSTQLQRQFLIEGYVDGSHGRLTNQVEQSMSFDSEHHLEYVQPANQAGGSKDILSFLTVVNSVSQHWQGEQLLGSDYTHVDYPLSMAKSTHFTSSGREDSNLANFQTTDNRHVLSVRDGITQHEASVHNDVILDARDINDPTNPVNTISSHQSFDFSDSLGSCYHFNIASAQGLLVSSSQGNGCHNDQNSIDWRAHPDGSPDSLGWISP